MSFYKRIPRRFCQQTGT